MIADVSRSTWLFDRLGDERAARLVANALQQAAAVVASHHGRILRSKGDDLLCIFVRSADALRAALEVHMGRKGAIPQGERNCEFKIGLHSGPLLLENEQLFGDTVNVAARLSDLAKAGQTLLTSNVMDEAIGIDPQCFRPLHEVALKGKSDATELFEMLDPSDAEEITQIGAPALFGPGVSRLVLKFQSREVTLDYRTSRFLLGRSPECDLTLTHPMVSRHHAEIRYQNGAFVLEDYSTNGTILITKGEPRMLNHGQSAMSGAGSVFLGRTNYNHRFEIAWRTGTAPGSFT